MKSRRTQNESLFGADFGPEAIGPFFFENEQGEAVTVNIDRYRAMLNELLFTKIDEEDIGNIWFQQDGATCHTVEATLNVLHALKDNICEAIGDIQLHTIDNVLKNCTDRKGYCMASRGSYLNEIIFHY